MGEGCGFLCSSKLPYLSTISGCRSYSLYLPLAPVGILVLFKYMNNELCARFIVSPPYKQMPWGPGLGVPLRDVSVILTFPEYKKDVHVQEVSMNGWLKM